jgi:hypothetical protein
MEREQLYNPFVAMSGDPYNFVDQLRRQGLDIMLGVALPLEYAEKKLNDARQAAQAHHEKMASYVRATYTKARVRYGRIEAQRLGYKPPEPFNAASWMRTELDQMVGVVFDLAAPFIEGGPPRISGEVHSAFISLSKAFNILAYQAFDKNTREAAWWELRGYAAVNRTDSVELPQEAKPLLQVVTRVVKVPYDGEQTIFSLFPVFDNPPYPTPWLDDPHTYTSE